MKLLNPAKRREYILEADRGSQSPTVFEFRRLAREDFFEFGARAPFTLQQAAQIERVLKPSREERREPTPEEQAELAKIIPDWGAATRQLTKAYDYALSRGLVRIRNLVDEDLEPLDLHVDEFLRHAPADVIRELGTALIEWSVLGEVERKNSGAQSAPGSAAPTAQSAPESTTSPTAA